MTSDEMRQHLEMLLADSQARHKDIELLFEFLATASKEQAERSQQQNAKIDALIKASQIDAENIRMLANVAKCTPAAGRSRTTPG